MAMQILREQIGMGIIKIHVNRLARMQVTINVTFPVAARSKA
jgi:hypothetical protein